MHTKTSWLALGEAVNHYFLATADSIPDILLLRVDRLALRVAIPLYCLALLYVLKLKP
jgi:hypothetical protein